MQCASTAKKRGESDLSVLRRTHRRICHQPNQDAKRLMPTASARLPRASQSSEFILPFPAPCHGRLPFRYERNEAMRRDERPRCASPAPIWKNSPCCGAGETMLAHFWKKPRPRSHHREKFIDIILSIVLTRIIFGSRITVMKRKGVI